eukprot:CAMPEP_0183302088 /NCGR_PEP_ID=MMETSP0160_2-20130417/8000_1 /TAXON_ID=2839 ORGANISM="Odontella Sinensis, Strain Grunow 1884" /NCGR_SAMPLE_ID=MMETSP0160_2 /ASSEMBLY_ACC=CAM_ASM_000250 /LENGTH=47 /DNA_ID= /DNA_START= /DNA_END= /DNA_ORIENTATION=
MSSSAAIDSEVALEHARISGLLRSKIKRELGVDGGDAASAIDSEIAS